MLRMVHPDIDSVADVANENTFRAVYEPRGWRLIGDAEVVASEMLGRKVENLDDLTVGDLRQLAANANLDVPKDAKKKAYLDALRAGDLVSVEPVPPTTYGFIPDALNPNNPAGVVGPADTSGLPVEPQES